MTTTDTLRRPGFITFLAVLHFVGTVVWVGATAACLAGAANSQPDIRFWMTVGAGIFAVLAGLQLACGIGLLSLKPYGRILQLVLAVPFFLSIPFGTAISILLYVYFFKPGIALMFSGRPATALSPDEFRAVTADSGVGGVALALILVIAIGPLFALPIVAAIAIPGLLRARMTANEVSATSSLDATISAQTVYSASCGKGAYAASYVVLGTPVTGSEPFIPEDLGRAETPQKNGYNFFIRAGAGSTAGPMDCMGRPTVTSWYAIAIPQTFNTTGTRTFATNGRDGVWQNKNEVPPAEPFGPPSARVR